MLPSEMPSLGGPDPGWAGERLEGYMKTSPAKTGVTLVMGLCTRPRAWSALVLDGTTEQKWILPERDTKVSG